MFSLLMRIDCFWLSKVLKELSLLKMYWIAIIKYEILLISIEEKSKVNNKIFQKSLCHVELCVLVVTTT